jgi:signal transduction histidine kinase
MRSTLPEDLKADVFDVQHVGAVSSILDVVCRVTGIGFAAVARVTEDRWIACAVKDDIAFGLKPGGELKVETTICNEIRQSGQEVVIDHVAEDSVFCHHPTPAMYGFQSYISVPIVRSNGAFFGTLCAIDPRPIKLRTPEIIGMFKLFADLISLHLDNLDRVSNSEATLADANKEAALREEFIAVLGHDLRNPLASIQAGIELVRRGKADTNEMLRVMEGSVSRMSGLIDNILDFARGRLGDGIDLDRSDVALMPVLLQVIEELRRTAPDREIISDIILEGPIYCDAGRIGQLLSNLLANALTHGSATTPVRVNGRASHDLFELTVSNSGPPIPAAALEKLFQPFFRREVRDSQEGLGLGLHIASEIARAHGGTLQAFSSVDLTTFTLRMPRLPASAAASGDQN